MKTFTIKKTALFILILAVFSGTLAPIDNTFKIKKAEAQVGCLIGSIAGGAAGAAAGSVATAVGAAVPVNDGVHISATTAGNAERRTRECILDALAYMAAKALIRQLTTSTVNWINSGFNGNPSFITNPQGFLLDVADETIGSFLLGSSLSFLCSPFQLDVKIALALNQRPFKSKIACTFTDALGNIDDFLAGDFTQGGWDSWVKLTTEPQNNIYGAITIAQAELEARVVGRTSSESKKLDWGSGFKSFEDPACTANKESAQAEADLESTGGSEDNYDTIGQECSLVTPGKVIEYHLNNTLGSGLRQLELADEVNEIVFALIGQLANQLITQASGLLGATNDNQLGLGSYIDRLREQKDAAEDRVLEGIIGVSTDDIDEQINTEILYANGLDGIIAEYNGTANLLLNLQACYQGKVALSSSSLTLEEKTLAELRRDQAESTRNIILDRIPPVEGEINDVDNLIAELEDIQFRINSTSDFYETQEALADYENFIANNRGRFHNFNDVVIINGVVFHERLEDIKAEMATLNETTRVQITECEFFPDPVPII